MAKSFEQAAKKAGAVSFEEMAKKAGVKPLSEQAAAEPTKDKSFMDKWKGFSEGLRDAQKDFVIGQLKGVGSTALSMGKAGSDIMESGYNATIGKLTGKKAISAKPMVEQAKQAIAPTNTAQKVGFGVEQVGEFFAPIPGGAKAKAVGAVAEKLPWLAKSAATVAEKAPKTAKVISALGKGIVESAEQAARTYAQEGEANGNVKASAAIGFAGPTVGKLAEYGLGKLGDGFFARLIPSTPLQRAKELRRDMDLGKEISQTGVSFSKKQLLGKIKTKINILGKQLDSAVGDSKAARSFEDVANNAKKTIEETKLSKTLQLSPLDLDDAKKTIDETLGKYAEKYAGKMLSPVEQQQLKRDLGDGLIKVFDRRMGAPVKARAFTETKLYGELADFLEKNVKGYKALNKKLAPLLESSDRMLKKGGYSQYLTDIVAGSVVGSTGGSILSDPVGFAKSAMLGILLKRGANSVAANTIAGTASKQVGKALSSPKFMQIFREAVKVSQQEPQSTPERINQPIEPTVNQVAD
jgi:hypothetical protein